MIIDIKTRWDSIFYMISRFLKIHEAIKKALEEYNREDLYPNESQMNELKTLESTLSLIANLSLIHI